MATRATLAIPLSPGEVEREATQPVTKPKQHIKSLDGLRGIAILLVLLHHLLPYRPGGNVFNKLLNGVAGIGWSGVGLFFVLSGFLITGILLESKPYPNYFRNFYARRTLRIFPLYYAFVFCCTVLFPLWAVTASAKPETNSWMWWAYIGNYPYAFTQGYAGWLSGFWSLAVEEHFYLIWPAFVFLLNRAQLLKLGLFCVVLGELSRAYFVLHHNFHAPYVWTPCRMDDLAMGSMIAIAVSGKTEISKLKAWIGPVAILSGVVALSITLWKHAVIWNAPVELIGMPAFSLFFAALLIYALPDGRPSLWEKILSGSFLRVFGKYSYALYVFNGAVYFFIGNLSVFPKSMVRSNDLFSFIVQVAASLVLAFLSWNLFEKHFIKMKKWFEPRPVPAQLT